MVALPQSPWQMLRADPFKSVAVLASRLENLPLCQAFSLAGGSYRLGQNGPGVFELYCSPGIDDNGSPQHAAATARVGRSGKGEKKEKNEGPLTKDFVTPFTPLSGVFGQVVESRWLHIVRMHRNGRRCSLYSSECHIPKLDVAGSSPVSRSMFSASYLRWWNLVLRLCSVPNQLGLRYWKSTTSLSVRVLR